MVIAAYLAASLYVANLAGGSAPLRVLLPQIAVAILTYPLAARSVGAVDRFRLIPVRAV